MRNEFFIRMKVYDNEMPELYARLERLPTGRIARRTALARVLCAGFAAIESKTVQVLQDDHHSSQTAVAAPGQGNAPVRAVAVPNAPPVSQGGVIAEKGQASQAPPFQEVALDAGDLEHLFGGN